MIAVAVALIIGGIVGYAVLRYIINGKYNQLMDAAKRDADVIKEKKLLADMRRTVRIINSGKSGLSKGWHILC